MLLLLDISKYLMSIVCHVPSSFSSQCLIYIRNVTLVATLISTISRPLFSTVFFTYLLVTFPLFLPSQIICHLRLSIAFRFSPVSKIQLTMNLPLAQTNSSKLKVLAFKDIFCFLIAALIDVIFPKMAGQTFSCFVNPYVVNYISR